MFVFYTSVNESLPSELFQNLLSKLPQTIQTTILTYKQVKDRWLTLAGKILLLKAFNAVGLSIDLDEIIKDKSGRPYVHQKADFNISHSGNYSICVLSRECRVGIDIEKVRNIDVEKFKKYMSKRQWDDIMTSGDDKRAFFYYWTIKESVLKADGRGVGGGLLSVDTNEGVALIDTKKWYYKEIFIDHDYFCHLASNLPINEINIVKFDIFSL